MTHLHFQCSMGAAGDMLCAALLELFPDKDDVLSRLNSFGIPGVTYSAESVSSCGVRGFHMHVEYCGMEEQQDDVHEHGHHHHMGLQRLFEIVDSLSMDEAVKCEVKEVYKLLAEAESRVHGVEMEHIHFHELGTMDALADICAVSEMLHMLAPDRITATPVCTGFGEMKCAHGVMPVPAPATALLLEGIPCYAGDVRGELCTPTGAALLKHFVSDFSELPLMTVSATGYGMGSKDFGKLNAVRAVLGESADSVIELCCNVDDMTPEAVGFAMQELLSAGALDAYYEPIGMKKNRPGVLLCCLCSESRRDEMVRLMFMHTSTLGIREAVCRRYVLRRKGETVTTPYGEINIKCSEGYGVERRKAEYDDLARIAHDNGLSLEQVKAFL